MVTATFRFYEELNDFLPPARRKQDFTIPCARAATTKHMIEALGVPHTEVELILVNGVSVGFERIVADAHLGGLARLLRMAGFDTLYRNDYADAEIAAIAVAEQRILLTRDRELLKLRDLTHGCYVRALKPPHQFREIVDRLDLRRSLRPFTRCLSCNAPLRDVAKAEVLDALPPSVRANQERFTTCDACGRVYWPGSHWRRMQTLLSGLCDGHPLESKP
jgi:uncharacterized protein with PIN domain